MKQYNIYNNNETGLGTFSDDRGTITDIFYKAGIVKLIKKIMLISLNKSKVTLSFNAC